MYMYIHVVCILTHSHQVSRPVLYEHSSQPAVSNPRYMYIYMHV